MGVVSKTSRLPHGAAMHATIDHRSHEDAAFEPHDSGWMYRSEAFAEDVDHLLPAVLAVDGPRDGAPDAAHSGQPRPNWSAVFAGSLLGRAQGAG